MPLLDYVRVYDKFFERRECLKLVRNLKNWEPHVYMRSDGVPVQHGNLSVSWYQPPEAKLFQMGVWHALDQYVKEIDSKDFTGWNDYCPIRFNRYDPGGDMGTHIDHIHSLFDGEKKGIPILSIVGLLNDDFQGGEFELCGEEMSLTAGSVLIFPSVFLYPHQVKKVLRGTRYSWVSWAW